LGSTTQGCHAQDPQYPVCLTANRSVHPPLQESERHKHAHERLVRAEKSTCTATDAGERA
jgi:hypothetical protein